MPQTFNILVSNTHNNINGKSTSKGSIKIVNVANKADYQTFIDESVRGLNRKGQDKYSQAQLSLSM